MVLARADLAAHRGDSARTDRPGPRYHLQHPDVAPWLDRFSLFDVYTSPWFAATYLLLLLSMTGCVLRLRLWRAVRAPPHPRRRETSPGWSAAALRRRRFRVRVDDDQICAEQGYLREIGT